MDKEQEERMKKIKKMQKRTARKQNFARQEVGYILTILLDALLTWVVWNNLIIHISPFPKLSFGAIIVLTLIVFSSIFSIASLVRVLLKRETKND